MTADESVLVEIFAHHGPLKSGQKRKVASDALKLITLRRSHPDATLILAFADRQTAAYARGDGWLAQALAVWDVKVVLVALDEQERERIRTAQIRQTMQNTVTEPEHAG